VRQAARAITIAVLAGIVLVTRARGRSTLDPVAHGRRRPPRRHLDRPGAAAAVRPGEPGTRRFRLL